MLTYIYDIIPEIIELETISKESMEVADGKSL